MQKAALNLDYLTTIHQQNAPNANASMFVVNMMNTSYIFERFLKTPCKYKS